MMTGSVSVSGTYELYGVGEATSTDLKSPRKVRNA